MLSEEEKKAINLLKSYENKLVYEISEKDKKAVKTVLNLIVKQSKEIEQTKYIKRNFDYCIAVEKKKLEDKIKAKIEELSQMVCITSEERHLQNFALNLL